MDQTTEQVAQTDEQTTTTTLSSDQIKEAEAPKVDFKSLIPEAYKEEKALQNFQDMDGFVKSFLHSQKLVGTEKINLKSLIS